MALSDTKIERALRKTVGHFYAEERYDDLTVKRVRAAAAEELGLDEGWFKAHEDWNARSKEVISSEVVSSIFSSHPSHPILLLCSPMLCRYYSGLRSSSCFVSSLRNTRLCSLQLSPK